MYFNSVDRLFELRMNLADVRAEIARRLKACETSNGEEQAALQRQLGEYDSLIESVETWMR